MLFRIINPDDSIVVELSPSFARTLASMLESHNSSACRAFAEQLKDEINNMEDPSVHRSKARPPDYRAAVMGDG